jgi:hypothetical protein
MRTHQDIDRRSLEMVRRIVAKIDADPERRGLDHAKQVCQRWVTQGIVSAREWLTILEKPWDEIRTILLDETDEGQRLRQTDPFCGILTASERWQIYREAKSEPRTTGAHPSRSRSDNGPDGVGDRR